MLNTQMKKERITPKKAKKMLNGGNQNNRAISDCNVTYFYNIIKNGEWQCDSIYPIVINEEGQLADGQHRLSAIVRANATVSAFIARGARIDAIK